MIRSLAVLVLFGFLATACASNTEEAAPAPVAAPAPAPEPVVEPEPEPIAQEPVAVLPDTASSLPAVGFAGLGALGLAGVLAVVRRRLQ